MNPDDRDIMISHDLGDDLAHEPLAMTALMGLFHINGRRPFLPLLESLGTTCWARRGARQKFARAISVLHVKGHLRWLPDGWYKVVSDMILTGAEYRERYPEGAQEPGKSAAKNPPFSQPTVSKNLVHLRTLHLVHLRTPDGQNLVHLRTPDGPKTLVYEGELLLRRFLPRRKGTLRKRRVGVSAFAGAPAGRRWEARP